MYPHRCSKAKCRQRISLPKLATQYVLVKLCPGCNSDSLKHDKSRKAYTAKNTCNCDGYHFPHRTGSLWCTRYAGTYTEQDYQDRYQSQAR